MAQRESRDCKIVRFICWSNSNPMIVEWFNSKLETNQHSLSRVREQSGRYRKVSKIRKTLKLFRNSTKFVD